METYKVTVEHCNAEHEVEAARGIECIEKFYAQYPKYFNDDMTYIILARVSSGVKVRYIITGRAPRHKIEMVGIV